MKMNRIFLAAFCIMAATLQHARLQETSEEELEEEPEEEPEVFAGEEPEVFAAEDPDDYPEEFRTPFSTLVRLVINESVTLFGGEENLMYIYAQAQISPIEIAVTPGPHIETKILTLLTDLKFKKIKLYVQQMEAVDGEGPIVTEWWEELLYDMLDNMPHRVLSIGVSVGFGVMAYTTSVKLSVLVGFFLFKKILVFLLTLIPGFDPGVKKVWYLDFVSKLIDIAAQMWFGDFLIHKLPYSAFKQINKFATRGANKDIMGSWLTAVVKRAINLLKRSRGFERIFERASTQAFEYLSYFMAKNFFAKNNVSLPSHKMIFAKTLLYLSVNCSLFGWQMGTRVVRCARSDICTFDNFTYFQHFDYHKELKSGRKLALTYYCTRSNDLLDFSNESIFSNFYNYILDTRYDPIPPPPLRLLACRVHSVDRASNEFGLSGELDTVANYRCVSTLRY